MNSAQHRPRILIIDDEPHIRRSITDFLEDLDYEVISAENGRAGLDILAALQPDLVLLDLRMPELDGLEVLKQGRHITPEVPMIVISGAHRISDVVHALRYGAWDYLEKPIQDLSILGHTVEQALEKSRLIKENRTYQDHLEQMIKERTLDLEKANTHLANINSRLQKIVETTRGMTGCVEMNQFSVKILEEFARHMVASGGSLYMMEDNGLRLKHALDPGHAAAFLPFPLAENSILNQVLKKGTPMLIKDIKHTGGVEPSGWEGYKDGSLLAFPIQDINGQPIGAITLHSKKNPPFLEQDREIGTILASYSCETLRAVQAFESVQKSEKLYRTLFEKTNDAIFIVDKVTGRYQDANAAAMDLTGYSLKELRTRSIHDVIPHASGVPFQPGEPISGAKNLGTVVYCRPDDTHRTARLSAVPLDDHAFIGIARDITWDLELEKQLRQSQKMEAIGTLAGGIAHDFNNILSGILGYAQLVEMNLEKPDSVQKNIRQVIKGSRRASGLVHQILTFSRQADHEKHPVRLHLVVKEALKFLRSSIPSSIEIVENIQTRNVVLADSTQIHQVVMNLCTNAYHAMKDTGGTITVSLSDVVLEATAVQHKCRPGNYILLEITDTGHGMEEKTRDRIFDPYFTTKKITQGTGLGLSVVDGIVKKHDGCISVLSQLDRGTTFQVYFPVAQIQNENSSETPLQANGIYGTENIMLVEDEEDVLSSTQAILESMGYRIWPFLDSVLAIRTFEKQPDAFDLVITDMTMPKMTGKELCQRVRELGSDIPIILCSGFNPDLTTGAIQQAGISRAVQKPVTGRDLARIIREELGRPKSR